ncbi:hypothetical protein ACRALDRAFT_1079105 [Sodiomyces alcalophilus JCM 7366]|uniref:uncharacterized protein n=1 Tax=Sodiomyces alcalophilus JCM 7366 TaxID=591952 RepID=UPI0039B6BC0A
MCYRVYIHTLKCDVRPVLSDGRNPLIDPYAPPSTCSCPPDQTLSSRLRCRHHGCCLLSAKTYECPKECRHMALYHVYIPRRPKRGVHFSRGPDEHSASWRDIPVFDGAIFPISPSSSRPTSSSSSTLYFSAADRDEPLLTCKAESPDFRLARDQLLEIGRALDRTLVKMDKADAESQRLRRMHARRRSEGGHGASCHAVGADDCAWLRQIANADEQADGLDVVVKKYQKLWERWKIYARALERKGERRIGGMEEWRRREGRGGEREEYDRLMGLYRRQSQDIRDDEADMRWGAEEDRGRQGRWEWEWKSEMRRYRSADRRKSARGYDYEGRKSM